MEGRDRHLIDDDEDEEEEDDDVYIYPGDVTLMRELNFEQHVVHQKLLNGTTTRRRIYERQKKNE